MFTLTGKKYVPGRAWETEVLKGKGFAIAPIIKYFHLELVKATTFFPLEFFPHSTLELHNDPTFLELYHLKNLTFVEHKSKLAFSHIF